MRQELIALYDDFTHARISRRDFLDRLTVLAGGAAAASAVIAQLAPNYALAAIVPEGDPRVAVERVKIPDGPDGYLARPAERSGPLPGLVIVHENRGLNPHIEDVARRAALEGFTALAPDFLTAAGGTPSDPEKAREMIGALPAEEAVADARHAVAWLAGQEGVNGKVGIVGFCWGGGIAGQVAVSEPELDAAVVFYGRTPPADEVRNIKAPLLLHYAGLDERINANVPAFRDALDRAGVRYELHMYEGANHAFHNDTSDARYSAEAAKLAWSRTVEFLKRELS
jgi:carboxymethylenebutenolidase